MENITRALVLTQQATTHLTISFLECTSSNSDDSTVVSRVGEGTISSETCCIGTIPGSYSRCTVVVYGEIFLISVYILC